jgi:PhnB protein
MGGTAFSGADVLPGVYERPQGFQVQLNLDDAAAAERIFTQLADGGRVTVPLQQTFWAQRFGAVVDRFGTPWGISDSLSARETWKQSCGGYWPPTRT